MTETGQLGLVTAVTEREKSQVARFLERCTVGSCSAEGCPLRDRKFLEYIVLIYPRNPCDSLVNTQFKSKLMANEPINKQAPGGAQLVKFLPLELFWLRS